MSTKWYYDEATREPITGVLPKSVSLPFKETPPPTVSDGQYVLAGKKPDWVVIDKPDDLADRQSEVERYRQIAYADPVTGSDRLFSESYRMVLMGEEGADEIRLRAIARFEEIQSELPWPKQ